MSTCSLSIIGRAPEEVVVTAQICTNGDACHAFLCLGATEASEQAASAARATIN